MSNRLYSLIINGNPRKIRKLYKEVSALPNLSINKNLNPKTYIISLIDDYLKTNKLELEIIEYKPITLDQLIDCVDTLLQLIYQIDEFRLFSIGVWHNEESGENEVFINFICTNKNFSKADRIKLWQINLRPTYLKLI